MSDTKRLLLRRFGEPDFKPVQTVAFILEELVVGSAGQQLLDRFLLGYARDGQVRRPEGWEVVIPRPSESPSEEFLNARGKFGLRVVRSISEAISVANAVVLVWKGAGAVANDAWLLQVLRELKPGSACFVHGVLASSASAAQKALQLASSRSIRLLAGSAPSVTWRLPDLHLPRHGSWVEGLIVTQQPAPVGELQGLAGLLPIVERRRGGESGVKSIRSLEGAALWKAGREGVWSEVLLSSALSRSDSPQGDPVRDGRTQDLWGRGLVERLARKPRGWILEHHDGFRSALLVLDGVVADINLAIRDRSGKIASTQLLLAPPPVEEHYALLASAIEGFLNGAAPWHSGRNLLEASLLAAFAEPAFRTGDGSPRLFSHCTPPASLPTICS